jgi:hypothetical protein
MIFWLVLKLEISYGVIIYCTHNNKKLMDEAYGLYGGRSSHTSKLTFIYIHTLPMRLECVGGCGCGCGWDDSSSPTHPILLCRF